MCKIYRILFLLTLFWYVVICAELNTTIAQVKLLPEDLEALRLRANLNATKSFYSPANDEDDTEIIEAPEESMPLSDETRYKRQLFYDPSLFMLRNYGAEGGKCINTFGQAGICLRFTACKQIFRSQRQFNFLTLRQWPLQFTQRRGQEICSFYDQFGRPSTGICCTGTNGNGNGLVAGGIFPSFIYPGGVNPIPRPPLESSKPTQSPQSEVEEDKDEEDIIELDHPTEIDPTDDSLHEPGNKTDSHTDDNVIYDPINEEEDEKPQTSTSNTAMMYNDLAYQWPPQFGGYFPAINQWPPPLPTHPPSTAVWPPPLPTHPPSHHYPTHPSAGTTRRTTTKRPASSTSITSTSTTTTTTRRPSYPSFPAFPPYPGYPNYPTYRPTTPPTTTRRPAMTTPSSSSGTSDYGLPEQCGIKNPEGLDQERIVGGTNASPNEFPWIAVLFKSGKQFCGGSVITKNHILTAAHCVARMTSWDVAALTAHLGDHDIRTNYEVQHVTRRIKRLVRHKGFDFSTLHNDIAILTLNEPIKFTYEIQPICLPSTNGQQLRSYSGKVATVVGWGSLRENGPQPSILQKVKIPIWSNHDCARKYGRAAPGGIIESMVCAGQAYMDSCSGDSGGPLIVNDNGRNVQIGIVSWGIGCGKGEFPGVYTRVSSLLPWIYKNIK